MSLKVWAANGWLRTHKTSRQEIQNLIAIVRRDLTDARAEGISADWRFGIAYNNARPSRSRNLPRCMSWRTPKSPKLEPI